MGWIAGASALAALLGAGASAYSAANPPKQPGSTQAVTAQGGAGSPAESVFSVSTPNKAAAAPQGANFQETWNPQTILQSLISGNSTQPPMLPAGTAPTTPTTPATTPSPVQAKSSITQILGSVPEALAAAAPLLGLMQDQNRTQAHVVGAQGGGSGGQMVPGLNLTRRTSLAELLASLPRPKYG